MATLAPMDPKVKPARKPLVVSLCIALDHQAYRIEPIAPGEDNVRAFRLVKKSGDGALYDIAQGRDGINRCDCPDYEARHVGTLGMCKHLRGAVEVGLIEAPSWAGPVASADLPRTGESTPAPVEPPSPCCEPSGPAPCIEYVPPAADPESFADDLVEAVGPEPLEVLEPAGTVEAYHWGLAILTRFGAVATDEQLRLAERIATDPETHLGRMIAPPGPSLAELAELAEAGRTAPVPLAPVKPAPLPDGRYSLVELVTGQAALFRGMGSAPFDLMADALAALAETIRATGASKVADYQDRIALMESDHLARLEAEAFDRGYASACVDSGR